jgi:hypothetical protein
LKTDWTDATDQIRSVQARDNAVFASAHIRIDPSHPLDPFSEQFAVAFDSSD